MRYAERKEILTLEIGQAIEDGLTKAEMQTLNEKLGKTIKLYVDELKSKLFNGHTILRGVGNQTIEEFRTEANQVQMYLDRVDLDSPLAIVRLAGKVITGKYEVINAITVKAGDKTGWGNYAQEDGWCVEWDFNKTYSKKEMPAELEAKLLEVYDELAEISEMYLTLKNHILTPEQVKVRTENAKAEKEERWYEGLKEDFEALVVMLETRISDYQDYCVTIAAQPKMEWRGSEGWKEVKGLDLNNPIAVAQVRDGAKSSYRKFIMKMTQKIGQAVESAEFSEWSRTDPWDFTSMTIVTKTGETQVWYTKVIVNYSVYGMAFNQFPTRRKY